MHSALGACTLFGNAPDTKCELGTTPSSQTIHIGQRFRRKRRTWSPCPRGRHVERLNELKNPPKRAPCFNRLEKPNRIIGIIPAKNDYLLPRCFAATSAHGVLDVHCLDVKTIERPPNIRMIVETGNRFTLQCPQAWRHRHIFSVLKRHAICSHSRGAYPMAQDEFSLSLFVALHGQ